MADERRVERPLPLPEQTTAGHRSRLIEKMRQKGADALSDQEVLETLLFFNYRRQDVKPIVKRLFSHYPDLTALLNAPRHELCQINQFGPTAADLLEIVTALHKRLQDALKLVDISLHDHLIVAGSACVSFKTQGLL